MCSQLMCNINHYDRIATRKPQGKRSDLKSECLEQKTVKKTRTRTRGRKPKMLSTTGTKSFYTWWPFAWPLHFLQLFRNTYSRATYTFFREASGKNAFGYVKWVLISRKLLNFLNVTSFSFLTLYTPPPLPKLKWCTEIKKNTNNNNNQKMFQVKSFHFTFWMSSIQAQIFTEHPCVSQHLW